MLGSLSPHKAPLGLAPLSLGSSYALCNSRHGLALNLRCPSSVQTQLSCPQALGALWRASPVPSGVFLGSTELGGARCAPRLPLAPDSWGHHRLQVPESLTLSGTVFAQSLDVSSHTLCHLWITCNT